ncbi:MULTISPECIES: hypothetical protein [Methylobacterium]|uniref:hypothetical protein n=1 Tax=Methylobacterium TaxID=407 RepID=UPI0009E8A3D5|nr:MULTISPECIES: hypothetical protein [Methylobacterium]MCI9879675.1 hypothetical protein [Methylobacterium goesingense]
MTTSRAASSRGLKVLFVAMSLAGGFAATTAQSAPLTAPIHGDPQSVVTSVQYWDGHRDWGHHRHHHHDHGYGHHRRHHGWGHRHHGWDHHRGWDRHHHHHHHHRGHGRYDY